MIQVEFELFVPHPVQRGNRYGRGSYSGHAQEMCKTVEVIKVLVLYLDWCASTPSFQICELRTCVALCSTEC